MTEYRVLVGMNYPGRQVEAGEVVSDIPKESVPWLLAQGVIENAAKLVAEPTPTPALDAASVPKSAGVTPTKTNGGVV